ncbi:radical SAM protein [Desulfosarcina cetonica]
MDIFAAAEHHFGQVQVEMTSRCNLRCRTCLYPTYARQWIPLDLNMAHFNRVLDVAPQCDAIHLQGWGESLLRDDIVHRIRDVTHARGQPTLGSNGTIMSAQLARGLVDGGLASMTFSLAGPDAHSNDRLRGSGTFAKAVAGIQTFIAQRSADKIPSVLINYLLTPYSYPRLPKALALASRLGVDTLVATHLVHAVTDDQKALSSCEESRQHAWVFFRSRCAVLWRKTQLILPDVRPSPIPVCMKNPIKNFFVGADGSVSPCVYLCPPIDHARPVKGQEPRRAPKRWVMGNLAHNSVEEIWSAPSYVAFRKRFSRRLDLYERLMPPIRTDFEGLSKLEQATEKIASYFATPEFQAPEPCQGCPHLFGY